MPFTEEELAAMFPDDSTQVVVDEECPEGFEKDETTGECVPAQLSVSVSEDFDPQEGLQDMVSMTDDLKRGPNAIERVEVEGIDKPIVPDLNYKEASIWGQDFITNTFERQYENGTLSEDIGYVDNLFGIEGSLIPESIQQFLDYEVLTDKGNKEIERVAKTKGMAAFNSLMQNNPTIRKNIIPEAYKEIEPLLAEEQLRLQKKYTAKDAAKAIVEFDEFRNSKLNEIIQNNPIFKQILEANVNITQGIIEEDIQRLGKDALGIENLGGLETGVRRMSRYLKEYQLMSSGSTSAGFYEETKELMAKNQAMAVEENWDDDTVVYIRKGKTQGTSLTGDVIPAVLDGREQRIPGEQGAYEKVTWKEAQEFQKTLLAPIEEKALESFDEAQAIKDAVTYFDKADLTDGITFSDFTIGLGEFLPQIPLGILTAGTGIILQETAGNYTDALYAIAKEEYGTDQPTPEQLFKLIEENKDKKGLAFATGIPQGAMELFGIGKMLRLSKAVFKAARPASIMRGQFKQVLKNLAGKPVRKAAITSGFYESLTETGQTLGSQTSRTIASGGKDYYNFDEILNAAGMGAALGLFIPFAGGVAKQTSTEFKNTASILAGKFNANHVENVFRRMETAINEDVTLTPEEKREKLLILGEVRTAQASLPKFRIRKGKGKKPGSDSNKTQVVGEDSSITGDFGQNLTEDQRVEAIELLMERQRLENSIKGIDRALVPDEIKEKIKEINNKLGGLTISEEINKIKLKGKDMTVAEDISLTKSFAQLLGIDVDENIANDPIAFQKFIDDNNVDFNIEVDSGFVFTDAKGNEKVYLNMPAILKNGVNFKTASHELMHVLLYEEVQKNPAKFRKKIDEFIDNNLSEQQKDDLNLLMQPYDDKYLESRPDEFITQMWDGGLFKKDNSLLQKFKDLVSNVYNTIIPGVKIDTENSSDLESFFGAYSDSYKTGKLSQKIIDRKKSNDKSKSKRLAKGKPKRGVAPLSKDITPLQAINKIIPLGITKDEYLSPKYINEAFGATLEGGVISNYISSKSTSAQQFKENIASIRDRLSNFNPEAVRKTKNSDPITFFEFITSNTNFSKLDANKKLAIDANKKAQEDRIDGGTLQIANQETTYSKPEADVRTTYPDVVIPKSDEGIGKLGSDYIKATKFNLKTIPTDELKKITYKTSKTIAPEAFADIWGLPLKVITQSNFNLSDVKNIRRVQSWIRDNALNLIKLLPEGNTSVKESDSKRKNADGTFKKIKRGGESLNIPENIRDNPVFYLQLFKPDGTPLKIDSETLNDKGKSKSKSNQYRKRPGITRTQFLKAFGVTDNKSDKQFDVRESEAQSIKGLLEITGRNITNYYAEQELDTRENISTSEKTLSKIKMRDGASKIAFSKAFNVKFTNEVNALNGNVNPYYDFANPYNYVDNEYGSVAADNFAADFINYGTEFMPLEFIKATAFAAGVEKYRLKNAMPFSSENFWKFRKKFAEEIARRKKLGLPVKEYSEKDIEKIKFAMQSKDTYFDTSKPGWKLKKDQNYEGGLLISKMFEELNKKYPQAINMTTAWFQTAVSSTSHPWRQISFPRLLDKDYLKFEKLKKQAKKDFDNGVISKEKFNELTNRKDGTFGTVKEHMWQQNDAADFLLPSIIGQTVDANWPFIALNYYQGGISRRNDNKLKDTEGFYGTPYNHGVIMVKPFKDALKKAIENGNTNDAIESIIRYLMPEVSNNDGGFNLNTLTFDNKKVAEMFNLKLLPSQINKQSIVSQQVLARLIVEKEITQERAREILKKNILLDPTIAKTSIVNNNKLPTPAALSKEFVFTNKNVLDKMSKLDTESNNARIALSKDINLNEDFNKIIEKATGIGSEKKYGKSKAAIVGQDKGKWDWAGIPPSAQDFVGLTRYFAGKGKQGDATIAWVKKNFLDPFARANIDISNARVALANDYKALKNLLKISPKDLNVKITGEPYTVGNAVRVYTWTQQGLPIPGLSKADSKLLNEFVENDPNLIAFSEQLIAINKDNGYPKPGAGWMAGTITTDLLSGLNTVVRGKYLKQWQANVDEVFTEENLNKLEAAFGNGYRDALENILGRMKTGSNRGFKGDSLTGRFIDWINGSVGAIMFFNMRSAVLQTISAINFVNHTDNNILEAAKAFGNQNQYWNDVKTLMNSDYLVERRNGLKINVNEADIAEIAAEDKNKAKAFIAKLLKAGFLPTQIADSFAIASGGATFYRNRIKSYLKEGMSQQEAEAQAFQDFREISEESQQSSRPDRISAQQAGPMGRIVLAFANTPAQYARLMQKAASDLKNRRGDDKTNMSKIIYYGAIQNLIFNALQQALFAMSFDDEEASEEKKNQKYVSIVNGMLDSLLRGTGFGGAAVSVVKNAIVKIAQGGKAQDAAFELLKFSPPVSSKISKIRSAGRTWDWNQKEMRKKGWSLDNPAWLAIGQVVSATTNIPLDRGIKKLTNLKDAVDAENAEWQRIANVLGWAKWELDWEKETKKKRKRSKTKPKNTF